ncbi:hypothetical protein I551_3339 [Mycobacterium ulcerans str. Harvey]|uniref:Uncharacterized protein n=1 Tax=Mycobacterium ulcerans str. Harvey TaxID=1299332 RepID=A0ABP3AIM5_MYCUL|nr:hypothetical protein I551_3339 [Mycobacterium ulcerans str. Harvey]
MMVATRCAGSPPRWRSPLDLMVATRCARLPAALAVTTKLAG